MTLSSVVIQEKNKQNNADSVFLCALEISIPGTDEPARVVLNTEDITWRGEVWQAVVFEIEGFKQTSAGEVPQCTVRVSNVNRVMEKPVQDYDTWCKVNGNEPVEVRIYEINTADLASETPCADHLFTLKQPTLDPQWATFTLSASNPANDRAPQNIIRKNFCSYPFKGPRCGYIGDSTLCRKTLPACRALGNASRFGGCTGAGKTGLTLGGAS